MAIDAKWADDSKKLIITTFEGQWTIAEFAAVLDTISGMMAGITHPVYVLVDGRKSQGLPRGGNLVPHLRRIFSLGLAHITSVTPSRFERSMFGMLLQFNRGWQNQLEFVETMDEAYEIINAKMAEPCTN